ncbi:MAG TPA: ribonuclease G, partial [Anaeromyxobacteraceae bacterium]|nr:ribonuclease G [Anaeromyxobacteraceae bacterium]
MAGSSILVINAAGAETRVALIENGSIHEYYLERKREKGIVGNIYKGRVVRVLPGMQAAFVDIGLDKAAFLYVGDVYGDPDFSEEFELTEGEHREEPVEVPTEQEAEAEEERALTATPVTAPVPEGAAAAAEMPPDLAAPPPAEETAAEEAAPPPLAAIPIAHDAGMGPVPTAPGLPVPVLAEGAAREPTPEEAATAGATAAELPAPELLPAPPAPEGAPAEAAPTPAPGTP